MTFKQAISFLDSRVSVGWKLGLSSMLQMLDDLDNPHQKSKFVHIAGTNGKGSVAAMLESIYRHAGYKTGLYTSPHLVDVRERIRVNGEIIDQDNFCRHITRLEPIINKYNATYFETMTAVAFLHFAETAADIVFLEVGLGGRLDATNVVEPLLSIITSISFDHTEHLGVTLPDIAAEKAGIIKRGRPCVVGEMPLDADRVIHKRTVENRSSFYRVKDLYEYSIDNEELGRTKFTVRAPSKSPVSYVLGFNGLFQVTNACLAIVATDILEDLGWPAGKDHVAVGLENVNWPGRFQVVQRDPLVLFDVAHNVAAVNQLVSMLQQFCSDKKIFVVLGLLKDKDIHQVAQILASIAYAIQPVEAHSYRIFPARELRSSLLHYRSKVFSPQTVAEGIKVVLSEMDHDSVLCVTGSHYVIGEAMLSTKVLTK